MKKIVNAFLSVVFGCSALGMTATVHAENINLSTLMEQWAAASNRQLAWVATIDFPVNYEDLQGAAHLSYSTGLDDSFNRIAAQMVRQYPSAPFLFACLYGNGRWEVRSEGQADCDGRSIRKIP